MNALIAEARQLARGKGERPASRGTSVVYILRLRSGATYVGSSNDLEQRLADHLSGRACQTTRQDPPTALLRYEVLSTYAETRTRERQLKRWSRAKKEALIRGDLATLRGLSRSRESIRLGPR